MLKKDIFFIKGINNIANLYADFIQPIISEGRFDENFKEKCWELICAIKYAEIFEWEEKEKFLENKPLLFENFRK